MNALPLDEYEEGEFAPELVGDESTPEQGLSEDDIQSIVSREIESARNFIENDVAPDRVRATEYARGMPFGDEETGRSQFVSRDVADTVNSIVPGLMRMFFGPEHVVEYVPTGPDDVEMAEQATDYVQHIFTKDNPGFLIVHSLVKDLLTRKCGIAKYWWDNSRSVTVSDYSGVPIEQLLMMEMQFAQDGTEAEVINGQMNPDGTANIRLKLKRNRDGVKIVSIPLEEFFINADATGFGPGEFRTMGHGRLATVSELVAMGYSEDELEEARGSGDEMRDDAERQARMPNGQTRGWEDAPGDASQEPIYYAEVFTYIDVDQDGLAELWKFCCAGSGNTILHGEIVDDHPFAEFPCDPEPHTSPVCASSIADRTMDVQKAKSGIMRATFDSLSESVTPRTVVSRSGVEIGDVLNKEIGAIIRADRPDMVVPLEIPFVGKDTFPMLAYMDEVRESRTGMSKTSMGLNPEALQNTTALAAANQFDKSHEVQELIARIMAETGFRRLFRGILRLIVQNQRKARMVNLRGKWVQVDPRAYKADMDVTANVALGGTEREKITALTQIVAKQEQIMATIGINNPMVTPKEYHNAISKLLAMIGFKNANTFFKDPAMATEPLQPPPPDPKVLNDQAKIELEYTKHYNDMAQKDAERQQDLVLRLYEINVKNKTALDVAAIKAQSDALRVVADLKIQASEAQNRKAKETVH